MPLRQQKYKKTYNIIDRYAVGGNAIIGDRYLEFQIFRFLVQVGWKEGQCTMLDVRCWMQGDQSNGANWTNWTNWINWTPDTRGWTPGGPERQERQDGRNLQDAELQDEAGCNPA